MTASFDQANHIGNELFDHIVWNMLQYLDTGDRVIFRRQLLYISNLKDGIRRKSFCKRNGAMGEIDANFICAEIQIIEKITITATDIQDAFWSGRNRCYLILDDLCIGEIFKPPIQTPGNPRDAVFIKMGQIMVRERVLRLLTLRRCS